MFRVCTDQRLCDEQEISWNAATVFGVMKQLMSLSYIKKIIIHDMAYTVLYRNMILQQIPYANIGSRTLSKIMQELIASGLVAFNDNHTQPAYAFTDKADKYITSVIPDGVVVEDEKTKKRPLFELKKMTPVVDLKPEYIDLLASHCVDMCKKQGIPKEEFSKFIEHHGSKGTKYKNYILAFGTWIRNYKKWNPNGGENKNGLLV